jgi:hypothetical protein
MLVDDEFEKLVAEESKVVPIESPQFRRLPRLSRVVRLSPDGSCSVGEEILRRVDDAVPHWNPHESAGRFVTRRLPPAIGRTAPPPGAHV